MDKKRAIVVLVLLIVALGAWALSSRLRGVRVDPAVAQQFQWGIIDLGVASSTPQANVILRVAGVEVPIGTYAGTCSLIDGTHITLLSGEASGVICTWQGKGKEIGIFVDRDKLTLKRGDVTEKGGSISNRTNFIELKKL